jgi:hypothetical protein
VVIQECGMDVDMKSNAISIAQTAKNKFKNHWDMAIFVKQKLDKEYGEHWSCVIGNDSSVYYTFNQGHMINMKVGDLRFIMWKSP